jgi:7,8-dihydropterin-6-yl-methyl-4-(beta-D-ribofuranosyl)aminobenzene 5'-phosphate synthase
MKLTILTDNNVLQSKNFLGEHGLSFYIKADNKKILFDTGYSDVFIKNALKMGINLLDLDYIVFSHGHYDHTWGLSHYLSYYTSSLKQGHTVKRPVILTHPDTFNEKFDEKLGEIGCQFSIKKLTKNFDIQLSKEPVWITENLVFLGEIPRINDFEAKEPIEKVYKNNTVEDDYLTEDSALAFKTDNGVVLITGCSHSGICNIVEHAKTVCDNLSVIDIIGGFHLVHSEQKRIIKTADYLSKLHLDSIHPCHCTDFRSKIVLSKYLKLEDTGVGLMVEYKYKNTG